MAELIVEEIEECIEGIEEGAEALSEEEQIEIAADVAEMQELVSTLPEILEEIKSLIWPVFKSCLKTVADIGLAVIIVYQVYIMITKKTKTGDKEGEKQKNVIEALKFLIKTENDLIKKLCDWLKQHKDDTIVLEGIKLPLESIIEEQVKPVSEAADKVSQVVKALKNKIDGKVTYNIPTAEDVNELIDSGEEFHKAFTDLVEFISQKVQKFKELSTFPIKTQDVEILTSNLKAIRDLPLW